jgi:hypothetical protein
MRIWRLKTFLNSPLEHFNFSILNNQDLNVKANQKHYSMLITSRYTLQAAGSILQFY